MDGGIVIGYHGWWGWGWQWPWQGRRVGGMVVAGSDGWVGGACEHGTRHGMKVTGVKGKGEHGAKVTEDKACGGGVGGW